jgi:hypothetical protein
MYASNIISDKRYRVMTAIEKAVWISIMLECWSNGSVPADPSAMSKWLGLSLEEVKNGLTERVLSFFQEVDGELISPALEEHWQKHLKTNKGKSDGGKKGAEIRYGRRGNKTAPIGDPMGIPIGDPTGDPIGSLNTIKFNSFKSNSVSRKEKVKDPFVDDMEAYEAKTQKVKVTV